MATFGGNCICTFVVQRFILVTQKRVAVSAAKEAGQLFHPGSFQNSDGTSSGQSPNVFPKWLLFIFVAGHNQTRRVALPSTKQDKSGSLLCPAKRATISGGVQSDGWPNMRSKHAFHTCTQAAPGNLQKPLVFLVFLHAPAKGGSYAYRQKVMLIAEPL